MKSRIDNMVGIFSSNFFISGIVVVISIILVVWGKSKWNKKKDLFMLYSKKHEYEEIDIKDKSDENKKFLNGKIQTLKLNDIITLTDTVKIYIFSYPSEYDNFGLGICKHIKFNGLNIQGKVTGKWNNNDDREKDLLEIYRSYTPVYINKKKKQVHFIIRIYKEDEQFIDGGKMSSHLDKLKTNSTINILGPYGLIEYKGNNELSYLSKSIKIKKHIVMIAGGTGMTPFFRLINHLLLTKKTNVEDEPVYITFIYANRNEQEILLKLVFDEYDAKFENFQKVYSIDKCLDNTLKDTVDNIGYINIDLLKKYVLKYEKLNMPIKNSDTQVLLCGPPPMISSLNLLLKEELKMENVMTL
ncbi:NADH-cytochrome b5 reductase, putative [Plasmodium vinckei vinckei]|uniref:NADH-cytochrome b5 reductase, putative n=1 Tax=Plasmodium vinckei vinckei TaxID=54757 RepID=A0A449BVU0_PLAVN|nr:NADH-cytochrome b5 reductase, putative [Plasmodium vinckei vinckei]KEG02447.1 cytochrome-b5 reductase [Plasmodium vinckei vinckei]VEV57558.1 NADH-cytochrome b5 reductase, putative [Plasmodium vinckei vinckei]